MFPTYSELCASPMSERTNSAFDILNLTYSRSCQCLLGARHGLCTAHPGTRWCAATAPGLLPFVVHEAKCTRPWQKNPGAWRRANDANLAAPLALVGYFLDLVLFEMLANTSRLQLPSEPFHVPRWRQASLLSFTLSAHHVMRVGHLESPMVWRSLFHPSPARLPLAWACWHWVVSFHKMQSLFGVLASLVTGGR